MRCVSSIFVLLIGITSSALAASWSHYANSRFGYSVDIPPGFSQVVESENGDGGSSSSPDERSELLVWGSYITEADFTAEVAWRINQDVAGGWNISYDKRTRKSAIWSGSKGDRIFYARALPGCQGVAVYFRIEYPRRELTAYDSIIERLVKSQRADRSC